MTNIIDRKVKNIKIKSGAGALPEPDFLLIDSVTDKQSLSVTGVIILNDFTT